MTALVDRLRRLHAEGASRPVVHRDEAAFAGENPRPAAVLVAITDRPEPGVLLIHRPSTMRSHPGQVAFPGGKIDPDEDAVAAALRETWEELGIAPAAVTVIGTTDTYHTGSGYAVTPVIAAVPADVTINPSPTEVAQWFEPPAAFVFDPANLVEHRGVWQGRERRYGEIMWQQHRIWGVTAGIIRNLAQRMPWHG